MGIETHFLDRRDGTRVVRNLEVSWRGVLPWTEGNFACDMQRCIFMYPDHHVAHVGCNCDSSNLIIVEKMLVDGDLVLAEASLSDDDQGLLSDRQNACLQAFVTALRDFEAHLEEFHGVNLYFARLHYGADRLSDVGLMTGALQEAVSQSLMMGQDLTATTAAGTVIAQPARDQLRSLREQMSVIVHASLHASAIFQK